MSLKLAHTLYPNLGTNQGNVAVILIFDKPKRFKITFFKVENNPFEVSFIPSSDKDEQKEDKNTKKMARNNR